MSVLMHSRWRGCRGVLMAEVWARRATSESELAAGSHFRRRKTFIDLSATARSGQSISTTSVAIEIDQPLVADPEVMRDLVEHDVPDLAA
jgi:hypothetical protein